MFDLNADGIIAVKDLVKFLARIELPFDAPSMHIAILKMYLPIIQITTTVMPKKGEGGKPTEEVSLYYLFNDVLTAITHLSTEKNIRAIEM